MPDLSRIISAWWNDTMRKDYRTALEDPGTRNERLMELAAMIEKQIAPPVITAIEPQLIALEAILEHITHLGDTAIMAGDYARAVGEARAMADAALARLRIIGSLLK